MNTAEQSEVSVLVVDDNPGTVTATVKFLQLLGYDSRGVSNGQDALAELSKWVPEVVLLDLGLPDIDGFTVMQRMREALGARPVRFIAVSGRSDEASVNRARDAGFERYLVKPVRLETLESLLPAPSP